MVFDRELIEARLALSLILSEDMPSVAVDALDAGLDGPAIRRLAILEHPTYFEVAEALPRAMRELGLSQIRTEEAALRIARQMIREILQREDDPVKHLGDFESLWIHADYAEEISGLGTLDDEVLIARTMGQSEEQIRQWVTSTLRDFASAKNIR